MSLFVLKNLKTSLLVSFNSLFLVYLYILQTAEMKRNILFSIIFLVCITCFAQSQQVGNATYYSRKLQGRHTSDGNRYHPDSMTCAHKTYPLGTILRVRNPKNDREVIVKVTDRGPFHRKLLIDLSYRAAEQLEIIRYGISKVEIDRLDSMPLKRDIPSPILLSNSQIQICISPALPLGLHKL